MSFICNRCKYMLSRFRDLLKACFSCTGMKNRWEVVCRQSPWLLFQSDLVTNVPVSPLSVSVSWRCSLLAPPARYKWDCSSLEISLIGISSHNIVESFLSTVSLLSTDWFGLHDHSIIYWKFPSDRTDRIPFKNLFVAQMENILEI